MVWERQRLPSREIGEKETRGDGANRETKKWCEEEERPEKEFSF